MTRPLALFKITYQNQDDNDLPFLCDLVWAHGPHAAVRRSLLNGDAGVELTWRWLHEVDLIDHQRLGVQAQRQTAATRGPPRPYVDRREHTSWAVGLVHDGERTCGSCGRGHYDDVEASEVCACCDQCRDCGCVNVDDDVFGVGATAAVWCGDSMSLDVDAEHYGNWALIWAHGDRVLVVHVFDADDDDDIPAHLECEYWRAGARDDDVADDITLLCARVDAWEWLQGRREPQQQTAKAEAPLYYVQDSRTFVGNSVLWWCVDGKGYTTHIDKAGKYTAAKVKAMRVTDVGWPVAHVDKIWSQHVDMQHLRQTPVNTLKGGWK